MSVSTLGLVRKWLLIAKRRPGLLPMDVSRGWRNTRLWPGCLHTIHTFFFSPATPSLSPFIHFFVLSLFYEAVWWWSSWVRGGRIRRGEECAVHQTARPSLSPNDDITGARNAAHTHSQTHTHISCRLASGCLSTRLPRWLTGALMECVTVESGVCMSLGVCGVSVCVCVHAYSQMHWWNGAWFTQWPPRAHISYELICDSTNS